VLPAIGQLALVTAACRAALGTGVLASVDVLRLQQPVGAGASLELRLEKPDALGRVRFTLRCGAQAVSAGTLTWSSAAPG
jgi:hypothetical protein